VRGDLLKTYYLSPARSYLKTIIRKQLDTHNQASTLPLFDPDTMELIYMTSKFCLSQFKVFPDDVRPYARDILDFIH
jgi:hypothetical protein